MATKSQNETKLIELADALVAATERAMELNRECGKGLVAKTYNGELMDAVSATRKDGDGRGETTYFRFRCFKRGTLHIAFKRMDIVDELNRIAGGKNLRGQARAR